MERHNKEFSIYRKTREERNADGFTMIPNELLSDTMLSPSAKMLLIYALSKPDDWHFIGTKTAEECFGSKNRTKLNAELRNLIARGWAMGSFQEGVIFFEKNWVQMSEEEQEQIKQILESKRQSRGVYGNHTGGEQANETETLNANA